VGQELFWVRVWSLAYDPKSRGMAAGSSSRSARIWESDRHGVSHPREGFCVSTEVCPA